jgi:LysR family transcriptional regulator, glycine cleavage system transcriptional activator
VALNSSHQTPRYDLMSMALNASAAGLGEVLLPDFMVADAPANGKVALLSVRAWTSERAYQLI